MKTFTKKDTVRTKIVCTIGPASASSETIHGMLGHGMSVARLNMAHGTLEEHRRTIQTLRAAATESGRPLALLMDLPGPRYRTGKLKDGQATLKVGATLVLTTKHIVGDAQKVSVNLPTLPKDVQVGDRVLLSDGAMVLSVKEVAGDEIRCRVEIGGTLKDMRGLVVPGRPLSSPFVTDSTLKQLAFGIEHKVDYFALSFVGGADDINQVRRILGKKGADIPLVSKIERAEAVTHLDDILDASDAVMVARGDLGVELPLEQVPVLQKLIVRKCNHLGKPVIVATQMLESMVQAAQPTRAEVADVANAIFDGTDAVMLSAETSIGSYPQEATAMMTRIAVQAEAALPYERMLAERGADLESQTDDAIAFDACHTAQQLGASAIIAFTESGSTAYRVAKYRPRAPLLALTPSDVVRRRLALVWGVNTGLVGRPATVDDMFAQAVRLAKEQGMVAKGDLAVITAGVPIGIAGTTNLLKVHTID